jgi:hypothetical protein
MVDGEKMFNYEKLETWQEAIAFADLIYAATKNFHQTSVSG